MVAKIRSNPDFHLLVKKRTGFAWMLTFAMLAVYFGFILLVAFNKPFLATPLGTGVMTVGIPIGLAVIVSAFVLTGIYVAKANSEFDGLIAKIKEEAMK
ncbi:MAG: DUF485 domain-containing protein [Hyphomicrobiaceae bacterium]|nr:DUF485 domain-containing protein [Hyphomicrobiaceae bacterium]